MKTFPLVLVAILAGTVSLHADLAQDISQKAVPADKGTLTQGYVYASSLYRIFTQNGVEAHLIQFDWSRLTPYEWTPATSGQVFRASFVVFRDSQGRYWGQESTSIHAKWLTGTTPDAWTKSFYSDDFTQVQAAESNQAIVASFPRAPHHWASTY